MIKINTLKQEVNHLVEMANDKLLKVVAIYGANTNVERKRCRWRISRVIGGKKKEKTAIRGLELEYRNLDNI